MREALSQKMPIQLALDPIFVIELAFVSHRVATGAAQLLEQKAIACLPDRTHNITVGSSAQRLCESKNSALVGFCSKSARGAGTGAQYGGPEDTQHLGVPEQWLSAIGGNKARVLHGVQRGG